MPYDENLKEDLKEENRENIKRLPEEARMIGARRTDATSIRAFLYDAASFREIDSASIVDTVFDTADCAERRGKTLWVHVDGLNDAEAIKNLGKGFGLHPLVVEDMLNTTQRPKVEDYGAYLFFVIKAIESRAMTEYETEKNGPKPRGRRRDTEQISFVVGRGFVFSLQELPGDPFATVHSRLKDGRGLLRQTGPDFLGYSLFDAAIDDSIAALNVAREKIDALEDAMVDRPNAKLLRVVHQLRRNMMVLPRTLRALTDMASACEHADSPLIAGSTKPYFRDLHDHLNSILDATEVFRAILSGMLDLYLSSMNNRMNEVMKTLTMISTIFIPLSFLAGVYGMNFKYMPEMDWKWSYLAFWVLAAAIAAGMTHMFKKKKWL